MDVLVVGMVYVWACVSLVCEIVYVASVWRA